MTYFKYSVLSQIKSAVDEKEVESIIELSIQQLKGEGVNGHLIHRFIISMDKTLNAAKLDEPSENVLRNVVTAVHLFRRLHRE